MRLNYRLNGVRYIARWPRAVKVEVVDVAFHFFLIRFSAVIVPVNRNHGISASVRIECLRR